MHFNIPIEEVMKWPMGKVLEYLYFLKDWFITKYGDPEEFEDSFDVNLPNMGSIGSPRKLKSLSRSSIGSRSISSRPGRGASGHKYQFKKLD